jgi:heptosyltransferase-2
MSQILIVGPSWVGDMIMAQSLFKAIRLRSPEAEIFVLAPPWSEPVLQRMPEVSQTIHMPVGHGSLQLGVRRRLAKMIRHYKFDQAIVLPNSFKSALIPWLADIPRRTGFIGEQRWGLLNDIRKLDRQSMPRNVERYVSLARDKKETVTGETASPELMINAEGLKQAMKKFRLNNNKPILGLCPGAEYGSAKRWPARHYAQVARTKITEGWQVWIFGSGKDVSVAEYINDLSGGKCRDLTGKTGLGEAVDLMSCARFVVTNDSGLMHTAAAVDCHVIAIYGSSSDEFTPPLTDKCDRLNLRLSCSPCFQRECPLGHLNCLKKITPENVLELLH